MDSSIIQNKFLELYDKQPSLVRSPGRVNLIGEHTDYNEGFVLPAAINKEMIFAVAPNDHSRCRIYSYDMRENVDVDPTAFQPSKYTWANYILGVIDQLQKQGLMVKGFDCVFGGDIPKGAGISSSAALECGLTTALNHIFEFGLDKQSIAKISQKAENEYVGVQCGIMDQFANMFGQRHQVIKLDCRSLEYELIPFKIDGYKIVLLDTNISHSLASSEYNVRRQQCEEGVKILKEQGLEVSSLRDVSLDMLTRFRTMMDAVVYRRCRYVIEENKRVEEACRLLEQDDLPAFGQKMYESHEGLSKAYEVSCEELDFLVDQTRDNDSVLGARMMGGGFGGCTINLVKEEALASMTMDIEQEYQQQFRRELKVYIGDIVNGTEVMSND
ncbi:galactokinase [Catalinimonas niigatensis]|uniref:galactokinase n=1 Tax=Catalinimonas niigatensis TaxID=1397264 RepID=UPI0026670539|nr:galactokinase [Catalinimonas niigatensis]WPP48153.1 galactokinase [Catalinimonas niigatensis]